MAGDTRVLDGARTQTQPLPAHTAQASSVWTATGLERQVFVDPTGRRQRRVNIAGTGVALLCAGWLATLVTSAVGFTTLPVPTSPQALTHVALHSRVYSRAADAHAAAARDRDHAATVA